MQDNITIEDVKRHARITHDLEDESVQDYLEWARSSVVDSLGTEEVVDLDELYKSIEYEKAVIMLAKHYYDNRMVLNERNMREQPFSVMDSIQKLSGDARVFKVEAHE